MWDSESKSAGGRDYSNGVLTSSKHAVKTDGFEQRGQSWYVATDVPTDFLVQIGDSSFHLHKMNRVIYESRDADLNKVLLDDLPGGPEAFELAAKFCYGIAVDLTATNISGIRWAYTGKPPKVSSPKWNKMKDSSPSRTHQHPVPPDWWFEDVSILRIDHFVRVITAIKVKGMRFELIGVTIMHYATKWLPGLIKDRAGMVDEGSNSNNSNGSSSSSSWKGGLHMIVVATKDDIPTVQAKDQRLIIESLISIIPPQKDSVSCSVLLRLLRMENMLKVAPALVTELEKRVGMQFEQATLPDLLIPSYNKTDTLVARLFQVLAEALPESARTCDDGLYRAIDSYLKNAMEKVIKNKVTKAVVPAIDVMFQALSVPSYIGSYCNSMLLDD
ncbi:unnamed protein product [Camellia sinensis]